MIGLAEMMNFPGVIAGDPHELEKLALGASHVARAGRPRQQTCRPAAAGIRSDHECYTAEEGRERLRAGMWVLIREASAARNLAALLPLVEEFGRTGSPSAPTTASPSTSPRTARQLDGARRGRAGVSPRTLVMATLNPCLCHGLTQLGALAPGYQADVLLLPDLERFEPELVLKEGSRWWRSSASRCRSG